MDAVNDDVIADVYQNYRKAPHSRQKTEALYEGVQTILFRLKRYVYNPAQFKEKSNLALRELENLLNRYYYHDKEFLDGLMYEAKAYVIEIGEQ
jgi:hypothetical protein